MAHRLERVIADIATIKSDITFNRGNTPEEVDGLVLLDKAVENLRQAQAAFGIAVDLEFILPSTS